MVIDSMHQPEASYYQQTPQHPNLEAQNFYKVLKQASEPLWDGCTKTSTLSATTRLLDWKSQSNVSDTSFDTLLSIVKDILPTGEKLPNSFYETKKMLKPLKLPLERIHVCINHCMLFRGQFADLDHCAVCGENRYKAKGRKVPNLVMTYMPIGPRLQRLFYSRKTAKYLTWHADHLVDPEKMIHPSEGEAWNHFDRKFPDFANEKRNIRLGLCTDGFSPNNSNTTPYSCWPVFLTVYNLPPWLAFKHQYIQLPLIIPGKKSPGQNLDIFLQPLVDELKMLFTDGIETYDAHRKTNFQMKVVLLWTVSDFPAYAILSGWSTHVNFLKGKKVKGHEVPVPYPTREYIWEKIQHFPTVYNGTPYGPNYIKPKGFGITHNWVKKSIFWELPYWRHLLIRHNLDLMHVEKNFFENMFHISMGTPKSKDNMKAREDIEMLCDRPILNPIRDNNRKPRKNPGKYTLTKEQVKKVCDWLKELKFPDGYASNIGNCVNTKDYSFYGFKIHDYHVFTQRLLPLAIRGFVPTKIYEAVSEISMYFRVLCSKTLHLQDLFDMKRCIVQTMCKLEQIYPPSFFDSMEHLVIHLADEAIVGGPVHYRWMYQYERKLGIIKRRIRNKARVEGSIVNKHLVNELATYCSLYFDPTIETRRNREARNFAPQSHRFSSGGAPFSIFVVPSRRLYEKSGKRKPLSDKVLHKAHTYILLNCKEVNPYIIEFDEMVIRTNPNESVSDLRDKYFGEWFEDRIMYKTPDGSARHLEVIATKPSIHAYFHNGYFVNGYKFHTQQYGEGRATKNFGVCVRGETYNAEQESDYYGILQEILEIEYYSSGPSTVVLFNCIWFDNKDGVIVNKNKLVDVKPNPHKRV
ncbi:uncharacterized protein LOC111889087 [Lactuca sativa]|uniref:uncharacterized protein LOC111889087 n=1 Tax=Lactuca sativa TaxID=4236 RepID=UPI0022AF932C|nr:uncharacterized protein LOC111889087 [Lactuca sativa]